jgi:integrase/recombinase XerD
MNLYKRHKETCQYRERGGKDKDRSHRCACSIYVEWNFKGKQSRALVRDAAGQPTSSWTDAEKLAAKNTESTGIPSAAPKTSSTVTVEDAVKTFLESKSGEDLSPATITKHKLTLRRLKEHCKAQGVTLLADVTLPVLTAWRATWKEKAPVAKRNNQERVRSFFRYCADADFITKNPALKLSPVKVKHDEKENVRPLEPKQFDALIKAVDHVKELTPAATVRVKALMRLQRYAGLALVDAAMLSKEELVKDGAAYRIVTSRQKSGEPVNNVIPTWLAEELLVVKNGNPKYVFWSGESTPKSAVSYFDKLYRKCFKQAKIPTEGQLSHRLRHTFAVELLKAGVDIRTVSKALGHASVTTTEKYYARWNRAQQDGVDAKLAGAWGTK